MGISIDQFIRQLSKDFSSVTPDPDEGTPLFLVEEVEVEMSIIVSTTETGEFQVQVVQESSDIGNDNQVHRVKVKLVPLFIEEDSGQRSGSDWTRVFPTTGWSSRIPGGEPEAYLPGDPTTPPPPPKSTE